MLSDDVIVMDEPGGDINVTTLLAENDGAGVLSGSGTFGSGFPPCRDCSGDCLGNHGDDSLACSCDINCESFGDCCLDRPTSCATPTIDMEPSLVECRSVYLEVVSINLTHPTAYWMISKCPVGWLTDNSTGSLLERLWIEGNCTSGPAGLSPASDFHTGRLYKNEFCSLCHNVSSSVLWEYQASCNISLVDIIQNSSTISQLVLREYCTAIRFSLPEYFTLANVTEAPRACVPHVSSCLPLDVLGSTSERSFTEAEYDELLGGCSSPEYNLVMGQSFIDGRTVVARNPDCATCNGLDLDQAIQCLNQSIQPNQSILELSPYTSSFLVTINPIVEEVHLIGTAIPVLNRSLSLLTNCTDGQLLDVVTGECRETVCLTQTPPASLSGPCIHAYASGESQVPSFLTCELITLMNPFHYQDLRNGLVFYLGMVVPVIGYDFGRPRICALVINSTDFQFKIDFGLINLLRTVNTATSVSTHGFTIFSIFASSVVLFTFVVFRKLHSIYGLIAVDLSIAFVLTDLSIIMGEKGTSSNNSDDLCVTAAIFLHFFTLAQFSWLSVLALDTSLRYYRLANSLPPRSKVKVAALYLSIGWGIPLIFILVSIIANFATESLVRYGDGALCLISSRRSAFGLLVFPILVAILFSGALIVGVMVILYKIPYRYDRKDKCNFGVVIALLVIMVTLGIIGIFIILNDSPVTTTGANFGFLMVNCARSIFFACAFLLRRKVIRVYLSLCGINRDNRVTPVTINGTSDRLEPVGHSSSRLKLDLSEGGRDDEASKAPLLRNSSFSPSPSLIHLAEQLENPHTVWNL